MRKCETFIDKIGMSAVAVVMVAIITCLIWPACLMLALGVSILDRESPIELWLEITDEWGIAPRDIKGAIADLVDEVTA